MFFSFRVINAGKTPVKLKLLFTRVKMVPCVHHSREVIELVFGRKETLRKNFIRMSRVSPRLLFYRIQYLYFTFKTSNFFFDMVYKM